MKIFGHRRTKFQQILKILIWNICILTHANFYIYEIIFYLDFFFTLYGDSGMDSEKFIA